MSEYVIEHDETPISKPVLTADIKLAEKFRNTHKDKRSKLVCMPNKENVLDIDEYNELDEKEKTEHVCKIGNGVIGTTFLTYLKDDENTKLVLKKSKRNKYSNNEMIALSFLREKMDKKEFPAYYIYCYTQFKDQRYQYVLLEKADMPLDDFLIERDFNTKEYLELFYQIADAIEYLESVKFNHGDLWNENIMVKLHEDGYSIKLIDYDCAYMANSDITSPNLGGSDSIRRKFIIGYDLNRYFDAILHSYKDYLLKKRTNKHAKIKKIGKKITKLEDVDDISDDESDQEFDNQNVIFTSEIVTFIESLECVDPDDYSPTEELSGKMVKQKILEYAQELELQLTLAV